MGDFWDFGNKDVGIRVGFFWICLYFGLNMGDLWIIMCGQRLEGTSKDGMVFLILSF
jgi:hypothetical protein